MSVIASSYRQRGRPDSPRHDWREPSEREQEQARFAGTLEWIANKVPASDTASSAMSALSSTLSHIPLPKGSSLSDLSSAKLASKSSETASTTVKQQDKNKEGKFVAPLWHASAAASASIRMSRFAHQPWLVLVVRTRSGMRANFPALPTLWPQSLAMVYFLPGWWTFRMRGQARPLGLICFYFQSEINPAQI